MAEQYVQSMKEEAINMLLEQGLEERALALSKKDPYTPIFSEPNIHPEDESTNKNINLSLNEIAYDISTINISIANIAYEYNNILLNTKNRFYKIEEDLNTIINKRKDIEMFDSTNAMTLEFSDFEGDFSVVNNCFCSKIKKENKGSYEILDIIGNGYEGNKHVISNNNFLDKTIKTDSRAVISDEKDTTIYEYSRINADNSEKEIFPLLNIGYVPAQCCITILSKNSINTLKILAVNNKVQINKIETSNNGIDFKNNIKKSIILNKGKNNYENIDYIEGSGIICFPSAKYINLHLQSVGYTDDKIGYAAITLEDYIKEDIWTKIEQKAGVKVNEEWKIDFSKAITDKDKYEVSIESDKHKVPVSSVLSNDKKSLLITPKENYKEKETYTLKVILNTEKYSKITFNTAKE